LTLEIIRYCRKEKENNLLYREKLRREGGAERLPRGMMWKAEGSVI